MLTRLSAESHTELIVKAFTVLAATLSMLALPLTEVYDRGGFSPSVELLSAPVTVPLTLEVNDGGQLGLSTSLQSTGKVDNGGIMAMVENWCRWG